MKINAIGFVLGLAMGVPVSYFLQSGILRAKLSLVDYVVNMPELLTKYPSDILPALVGTMLVCGVVAGVVADKMRVKQAEPSTGA